MRNEAFHELLATMARTHDLKNADYAEDGNPYSNFEFAAEFAGVSVEQVFDVLIGVKQARLHVLTKPGKTPNHESIDDTRLDQAVYVTLKASYPTWKRAANRSEPTTTAHTTSWAIGRFFCQPCNRLGAVVRHPDATVTCPQCGGPCEPASGDERR